MNNHNNGHEAIPDLSKLGKPTRIAWQIQGPLVKYADKDGYTPLVDGALPREMYATANDLVEMMRPIVRDEIRSALKDAGLTLGE